MEKKEYITNFNTLYNKDMSEKVEKKGNGKSQLSYLSWAAAWCEFKKINPDTTYTIWKDENNNPYVYDEKLGYMVYTSVTVGDLTHEMWLPVMDNSNKAMKAEPYSYTVKGFNGKDTTKEVKAATMFDINTTIMRCLTKNLAMHGLGLYIYEGEDIPRDLDDDEPQKEDDKKNKNTKKTESKKEKVDKEEVSEEEMDIALACTTTEELTKAFNESKIKDNSVKKDFYGKIGANLKKVLSSQEYSDYMNVFSFIKTEEEIEDKARELINSATSAMALDLSMKNAIKRIKNK